jgi:hypothetical protein
MPVDLDPHPEGNVRLVDRPGTAPSAVVLRVEDLTRSRALGEHLYRSHFVTCPNAARHRRPAR